MFRINLIFLASVFLFACGTKPPVQSTSTDSEKTETLVPIRPEYRSFYTKHFDLIHTRLNVSLNWKEKTLIGQAAIILRPHFYSTDSLSLNARGMKLKEVSVLKNGKHVPLKFDYDSLLIKIKLDKIYSKDESLTIFIDYISKPEDLSVGGSEAITKDKGLYFINADSLDDETPTQIWTQGETESNSVWFPTIEDPGQKMTQEIYITVDTAMTTISNGLLLSTVDNGDGTKTDYWKQSLPAAPYLAMIAVGKYSVVKDSWKNIEVSYYVDPPYEKYARMTFGNTPEMLTFFSDKLGVPYVWEKYSQVVVHDYVSGAMENNTAVIHGTNMQQDPREFADGSYEDYVAHELFHHWFGNLVTCKSWSNISLNESFANYSEYIWREYKYGRDNADRLNQSDLATYLSTSARKDPPLFRSQYDNREDVYDAISYDKGGRVLHMLRNYTGDDAFYASLNDYLTTNMYSSAEIDDLRRSFEKITGEDLNWFFDQWYLNGGHPVINIDYNWNDSLHFQTVTISQKQKFPGNPIYKLPIDIDIYYQGKKERKKIMIDEVEEVFKFDLPVKPDLVNVDAEKILLCTKTDNKSNQEYIFQYDHAPLYLDRYEAVAKIGSSYQIKTPEADMMVRALHDKFHYIRFIALNNINELAMNDTGSVKAEIVKLATSDSSSDVREKALSCIGKYFSYSENSKLIEDALKDSSYKVVARAFKIILDKDIEKAKRVAPVLEKDSGTAVIGRLSEFYSNSTDDKTDFYKKAIRLQGPYTRYQVLKDYTTYLKATSNMDILSKGINVLVDRAKRPNSKHYRAAIFNNLHDIEAYLKKKISDNEESLENVSNTSLKIEKQAEILELTTMKNKLQEKLAAIEK